MVCSTTCTKTVFLLSFFAEGFYLKSVSTTRFLDCRSIIGRIRLVARNRSNSSPSTNVSVRHLEHSSTENDRMRFYYLRNTVNEYAPLEDSLARSWSDGRPPRFARDVAWRNDEPAEKTYTRDVH